MEKISDFPILQKRLNRKEFLIYLLGIVMAILGINALLKILNPSQHSGFGSGPYGGIKK